MQAYLNDLELKKQVVKLAKQHQKADQIIQGTLGILENSND